MCFYYNILKGQSLVVFSFVFTDMIAVYFYWKCWWLYIGSQDMSLNVNCDEVAWIYSFLCFVLFCLDQHTIVGFPFSYTLTLLRWGEPFIVVSVKFWVSTLMVIFGVVLWLSVYSFSLRNCHSIWLWNLMACSGFNLSFVSLPLLITFCVQYILLYLQGNTLWLLPFFYIFPIACKVWGGFHKA